MSAFGPGHDPGVPGWVPHRAPCMEPASPSVSLVDRRLKKCLSSCPLVIRSNSKLGTTVGIRLPNHLTIFIYFFKDFIYSCETQRERQRHRQREKQAPCREPYVGLESGTSRSRPGLKAALNHWAPLGCPTTAFKNNIKFRLLISIFITNFLFLGTMINQLLTFH